jgi:FkbH-like protein
VGTRESGLTPLELVVTANFTAEPVEASLGYWLQKLQLPANIRHAPFDQVFQQLLDPGSLLRGTPGGIGLLLLRLQDWLDAELDADRIAQELVHAVQEALAGSSSQLMLCLCPVTGGGRALRERVSRVEIAVANALEDQAGVRVLTSEAMLDAYPCSDIGDAHGERLAGMPYSPEGFCLLGTALARCLYGLAIPAHKVLVLDCDDSLWGGLCGERGPRGVTITPEHRALQRFAVEQRRDGKLICLASRNNEADVLAVFDQHPDMVLTRDDLTAWEIHWGLKSDSLAALAGKLGLGLDSFVFLDDDAVQCAEVRRRFPEVLAMQLPRQGVGDFCRHIWPLDPRPGTAEGAGRTGAYRDHAAREDVRATSVTFQQFLDSLDLQVDIAPLAEPDLTRASELTHRTNQFNLTGLRMNEAELRQRLQDASVSCAGVRVRDRFGDYGLVGLILAETAGEELRVPVLLLSCRALGRGVEQQMVAHLGRLARERGSRRIALHCVPSQRNDPAREFLRRLGAVRTEEDGRLALTLETAAAQAVRLDLDSAPQAGDTPKPAGQTLAEGAGSMVRRVDFLATVPLALAEMDAIVATVHGERAPTGNTTDGDPVQAALMRAFAEQLGVAEIPADVGFFELGGESLQAMQILSKVSGEFGVELDATLLFTTNFTVEELAEEINGLCDAAGASTPVGPASLAAAPDP